MLEIIVHGLYIGAPHDVGAAGALVTWGGEELMRFQESYRGTGIRSPLGAELRILCTAFEWARDHGGMGETVIVRTALGSLAAACQGRGLAGEPDLLPLVESLERTAWDFEGVHAEIAPAWVTAPAQDAALRCLVGLLEGSSLLLSEPPPPKRPPAIPSAGATAPRGGAR